jgi:hypothetical protein
MAGGFEVQTDLWVRAGRTEEEIRAGVETNTKQVCLPDMSLSAIDNQSHYNAMLRIDRLTTKKAQVPWPSSTLQ